MAPRTTARPRLQNGSTERIAPEYSALLNATVQAEGLTRKSLSGPGRSAQVVWRVLDHQQEPSFNAAERVRQRILELCPHLNKDPDHIDLPPPAVAVAGVDHYEWMSIGSNLMAEDIEGFRRVLDHVREVYTSMKKGRAAMDELQRLAAKRR